MILVKEQSNLQNPFFAEFISKEKLFTKWIKTRLGMEEWYACMWIEINNLFIDVNTEKKTEF